MGRSWLAALALAAALLVPVVCSRPAARRAPLAAPPRGSASAASDLPVVLAPPTVVSRAGSSGARSTVGSRSLSVLLAFGADELPDGIELEEPSWLFPKNPVLATEPDELGETAAEMFDPPLSSGDIRQMYFAGYGGDAEVFLVGIRFRDGACASDGAVRLRGSEAPGPFRKILSGDTLVLVVHAEGSIRLYREMIRLVEGALES